MTWVDFLYWGYNSFLVAAMLYALIVAFKEFFGK